MSISIHPVDNHRSREKGVLVYPVYSRRSGGLSVGINLYPGKKCCPFDCPYCEVFPFSANAAFSADQMEKDLCTVVADAQERNIPVKDICFSGNGEPSLAPDFPAALQLANRIRQELVPSAQLVLITNGAGLFDPPLFSLLRDAACDAASPDLPSALTIWLKLDAGTPAWYDKINRSAIPFAERIEKIKTFAACAPFIIQTMLCAIDGTAPPPEEAQAWETTVCELAAIAQNGSAIGNAAIGNAATGSAAIGSVAIGSATTGIRAVQLYGKARPAPEDPKAEALPDAYLAERAASLRRAFTAQGITTPVEVYL